MNTQRGPAPEAIGPSGVRAKDKSSVRPGSLKGLAVDDAPVFDRHESVESGRIRLSHLTPHALQAMVAWLEPALSPEWTLENLIPYVAAGAAVLVADAEGEAIGVAVALLDRPAAGAACMPLITVDPSRRFRGLGGEAGLALERHLRRKFGVASVFAPVPEGRGLAVYFWLRLGYRPVAGSAAPWPLVGLNAGAVTGIWMRRDLD